MSSTNLRLELSLRFLAKVRTCAAIFAGKLTLWRTVLSAVLITPVCTRMVRQSKPPVHLSRQTFFKYVEGGLGEVGRPAEVAPVEMVGAEGDDFLAFGG